MFYYSPRLYDSVTRKIFVQGPMIAKDMCLEKWRRHCENQFVCWKPCFLKALRSLIFYLDDQIMELRVVEMIIKLPLRCN